jgi:hypothetical protein
MTLLEEYLASLEPKEKQAYEIAKKNLGSLLALEKTNHYIKWRRVHLESSAKLFHKL